MTIANAIALPAVTPLLGVCQVAVVDPVAVRTAPDAGAAEAATETAPVAVVNLSIPPVAVIVPVIVVLPAARVVKVPTEVKLDANTVLPRTVLDNTFAPLI
jgi:hypothetical protein